MEETLTQQSDKEENQKARDTNATIRQKDNTKMHETLTQQSDRKEN